MAPSLDAAFRSPGLDSELDEAERPTAPITHMASNRTSTHLATAHSDNRLLLWSRLFDRWNLESERTTPHKGIITGIAFAPEIHGQRIATAGEDGVAAIYDISATHLLRDADTLSDVAFSDAGTLATLGAGIVRIYTPEWALQAAVDLHEHGRGLAFAPGGAAVLAGGAIVRRIGADWEWELVTTVDNPQHVVCADWGRAGFLAVGREAAVELWALRKGVLVKEATFEARLVSQLCWDCVGVVLAVTEDGATRTFSRRLDNGWVWAPRKTVA